MSESEDMTYLGRERSREGTMATGNETWSTGTELWMISTRCSPGLIDLDRNILTLDISAVHLPLCKLRVVLVPKLDNAGVLAESGVSPSGGEGAKGSEEEVELGICVPGWELLDETRGCIGRRQGRGRRRWWVWRQHQVRRRVGAGNRQSLECGERHFGCGKSGQESA